MKIIGDKSRLKGLNVKITLSGDAGQCTGQWYWDGEIYNINHLTSSGIHEDRCNDYWIDYDDCKIILDNDFLNEYKKQKISVNCKTEQEATEFCKWMHNKGLAWRDGEPYIGNTYWFMYESKTCYKGNGMYGHIDYDERNGYTILSYEDLVQEEVDFMETDEFNEFCKYWKENDVYVKFDNILDKKRFTKNFDGVCQGSETTFFKYVHWVKSINEWAHTYIKEDGYKTIEYKDIKNWKEILLNKEKEMEKEYEVIEPITIKKILNKIDGNEFVKWVDDFISEFTDTENYTDKIINYDDFENYYCLVKNVDWFIENGFIKEKEKEFEPFTLNLDIKTEDELLNLYHRFNSNKCDSIACYCNYKKPLTFDVYSLWR
jgi:hypothetical protein